MSRFFIGLTIGLLGGYVCADRWLKRHGLQSHEQEDLIEIDRIPLPTP